MVYRNFSTAQPVGNTTYQGEFPSKGAAETALGGAVPAGQTYTATVNGIQYIANAGATSYTLIKPGLPEVDTVADMTAAVDGLNDGDLVSTKGYYSANDGGGNSYVYHLTGRSGATIDGGFGIAGSGADDWFEAIDQRIADPEQFGCVGDGVTDDINSLDAMVATGADIVFKAKKQDYAISRTWVIDQGNNVDMADNKVVHTGLTQEPVLQYGVASGGDDSHRGLKILTLSASRENWTDWSDDNDVAIRLYRLQKSHVRCVFTENTKIGVQCIGGSDGSGFGYTQVRLGNHVSHAIPLDINANTNGWINQNVFTAGELKTLSASNPTIPRYGIRIIGNDDHSINNNTFESPSIELKTNAVVTADKRVVWMDKCSENVIRRARHESSHDGQTYGIAGISSVYMGNDTSDNKVTFSYIRAIRGSEIRLHPFDHFDDLSARNFVGPDWEGIRDGGWHSGHLASKLYEYDGDGRTAIRGLYSRLSTTTYKSIESLTNVNSPTSDGDAAIWRTANHVMAADFLTDDARRLVVAVDLKQGSYEIGIVPWDSNGNVLLGQEYVRSYFATFEADVFGVGGYTIRGVASRDFQIHLRPEVYSVTIGIYGGTSGLPHFRSWAVWTDQGTGIVTQIPHDRHSDGSMIGSAPPATSGLATYIVGERLYNISPPGAGWVCTTSGDPGTWTPLGSRKEGADDLGTTSGSITVDFDAGDYDNKVVTLDGAGTLTLDATRPGAYYVTVKSDSSTERSITWVAGAGSFHSLWQSPTSVGSTDGITVRFHFDGSVWYPLTDRVKAYGAISVHSNSTATTIASASSDWTNKVQVTSFAVTNTVKQNTTPDHTTDDITIDVKGDYESSVSMSVSGTAGDTISFGVFKNNGLVLMGSHSTHTLSGNVDNVFMVPTPVPFIVGDTVEVWVQNETAGRDITIEEATLQVIKVD